MIGQSCAQLIVIDPVYVFVALAIIGAVLLLRSVPVRCDRCHHIVRTWVVIRSEKRGRSITLCDPCLRRQRMPVVAMEAASG